MLTAQNKEKPGSYIEAIKNLGKGNGNQIKEEPSQKGQQRKLSQVNLIFFNFRPKIIK